MTHTDTMEQRVGLKYAFAERMENIPKSFIREILKVAGDEDIISFAGGLPNAKLFPVGALKEASNSVFSRKGAEVLQYSNSEGYLPLREYIANRYFEKEGLQISPEEILITSGSQQALDLIGKVMIDQGDKVIMEEPGYLGAIQAFSLFKPEFIPVPLRASGMDTMLLKKELQQHQPKLMYVVPDFQNPSGISYSEECRESVVRGICNQDMVLVEDTPYTDIRFSGKRRKSLYSRMPNQTILLGTFSKTAVPGFRLGWMIAGKEIMEKLIIAKQAADLHTSSFTQILLYEYLVNNDIDKHIRCISQVYGRQRNAMLKALKRYFPDSATYTCPDGGMFLWVTLAEGRSTMELFRRAIEKKVAFVPGNPFYVGPDQPRNTLRLNFSCSDEKTIDEGIRRIAEVL